jgi:GNAT superfamily N-acetyltransferase
MSASFTTRDMEPADREAVIGLMLALNRFEDAISGDRVTDRRGAVACLADDQEKLRAGGGLQLVAVQGDAVAGYMCCAVTLGQPYIREDVRTYVYVHTLVVSEAARGAGVGAALMGEAESFARGQGVRSIAVGHLAGNLGAGRLYERLGFQPHAVERVKWLD